MADHRSGDGRSPFLTGADAARRTTLRVLVAVLAITDVTFGGGYVLGAPASAPSLVMIDEFGGIGVWGAALAVAGVCLCIDRIRIWGFALGGFIWMVWLFFSVAVLFNHTATGWGWPPYFALAAMNVIGTLGESQAAQRRR